jgi:hypothetical protein
MRFVDIEEARAAAGLRLVIAGNVSSPWSQAAMGIFDLMGAIFNFLVTCVGIACALGTWGTAVMIASVHRATWPLVLSAGVGVAPVEPDHLGVGGLSPVLPGRSHPQAFVRVDLVVVLKPASELLHDAGRAV